MNRLGFLTNLPIKVPSISWGCIGLVVGVIIGVLTCAARSRRDSKPDFVELDDLNNDGSPDSELVYERGFLVRSQSDRNFDGTPDVFQWYERGVVVRAESDDNFDGVIDGWISYRYGEMYLSKYDTDGNGIPDLFLYFEHGVTKLLAWRPNEASKPTRIEVYEAGLKVKELRDKTGGGAFDTVVEFDQFGLPVLEKSLIPSLNIEDELRRLLGQK